MTSSAVEASLISPPLRTVPASKVIETSFLLKPKGSTPRRFCVSIAVRVMLPSLKAPVFSAKIFALLSNLMVSPVNVTEPALPVGFWTESVTPEFTLILSALTVRSLPARFKSAANVTVSPANTLASIKELSITWLAIIFAPPSIISLALKSAPRALTVTVSLPSSALIVSEVRGLRKEMLSKVELLLRIIVLPIPSAWTTISSSMIVALNTRSATTVLSMIGSKPA